MIKQPSDVHIQAPDPSTQPAEAGSVSTLLPMLIAGLGLIVVGMIFVMIFV